MRTLINFRTVLFLAAASIPFHASAQWIEQLPVQIQRSILWAADHEEGSLYDWTLDDFQYAGGGIFNTGGNEVEAAADQTVAHSGNFSARATITGAVRALNGNRAVRLMRWTDRAWDDNGDVIPRRAFYSTWMYFPRTFNPNKYAPWDPGDGGWWNIFQFKADDENGDSQPMWTLNVEHNDAAGNMHLYLYSGVNSPPSYGQQNPVPVPVGRWVHIEALYVVSAGNSGSIRIWQDGKPILGASRVRTALWRNSEHAVWGIGNYTNHINSQQGPEGSATIYFDDAIISRRRVSAAAKILHSNIAAPTANRR